jgi:hypothetical protein
MGRGKDWGGKKWLVKRREGERAREQGREDKEGGLGSSTNWLPFD